MENTNDTYLVQCDFINAFNEADRLAAFYEVLEHFPELAKWVSVCYGSEAALLLGGKIILSSRGFHQGDPLAPLLFALLLLPVILLVVSHVPNLELNTWLLDDGILAGVKADIIKALQIIIEEGSRRGLRLSTLYTCPSDPKSRVWCSASTEEVSDPLGLGIPRIQEEGFIHLGSPIGSHKFIEESLSAVVKKVGDIIDKLHLLQDSHFEFVILRSCLSIPKVTYNLRTTPPSAATSKVWIEFDILIRDALSKLLGCNLAENEWKQAQLPLHLGGLGFRGAPSHSSSAFLGSILRSEELIHQILNLGREGGAQNYPLNMEEALAHLSIMLGEPSVLTFDQVQSESQKSLSYRLDTRNHELFIQSLTSDRSKARLGSLGLPNAGAWLNVVPRKSLGLDFRSQEFRACVLYRLGVPLFSAEGPCPACSAPSDVHGDHAISCGSAGERISQHNLLRDAVYQTAVTANLAPLREERAILPGTDARPADVLIPNWGVGPKDMAIDVTVVNPLRLDLAQRSASEPGLGLKTAFNTKWRKYGETCDKEGITFCPFVLDTFGAWDSRAVSETKRLGQALARSTGQLDSEVVSHLFQRLSVLLMRGNALLLINRIPDLVHPCINGDL